MTSRTGPRAGSRLLVAVVVLGMVVAAAAITRGLGGLRAEAERASAQSSPPPLHDGMVAATEGGLDGGGLWFLWDDSRQRIQRPRPISEQDVRTLGLTLGAPAERLTVAGGGRGSSFAVYPAMDPGASLHLLVDDVLYPVAVRTVVDLAALERPDLETLVIDRLAPAP